MQLTFKILYIGQLGKFRTSLDTTHHFGGKKFYQWTLSCDWVTIVHCCLHMILYTHTPAYCIMSSGVIMTKHLHIEIQMNYKLVSFCIYFIVINMHFNHMWQYIHKSHFRKTKGMFFIKMGLTGWGLLAQDVSCNINLQMEN